MFQFIGESINFLDVELCVQHTKYIRTRITKKMGASAKKTDAATEGRILKTGTPIYSVHGKRKKLVFSTILDHTDMLRRF